MLIDTHAHLDFPTSSVRLRSGLRGASTDDIQGIIDRAREAGVNQIICVGTSIDASKKCVEIAKKYSGKDSGQAFRQKDLQSEARMTENSDLQIYATVGIHAQDGKEDIEKYGSISKCIDELRQIVRDSIAEFTLNKNKILRSAQNDRSEGLQNDKGRRLQNDSKRVVAVGECGYDIRQTTDPSTSPSTMSSGPNGSGQAKQLTTDIEKKFQGNLFEAQIGLSVELGLPLVVHCRNAWDETFELLSKHIYSSNAVRSYPKKSNNNSSGKFSLRSNNKQSFSSKNNLRGVFHSWTGDWEAAKKTLDLGFYISFSGIVTFKNAPNVQEVAKKMPVDRMLLETDSPFLSPEPFRGKQNEPKNVRIVAEFIAKLRNLPLSEICDITSQNAERLFRF